VHEKNGSTNRIKLVTGLWSYSLTIVLLSFRSKRCRATVFDFLNEKIIRENSQKIVSGMKSSAATIKNTVSSSAKRIDSKHEAIAEGADDLAKTTKVVAGVSAVGAVIAEPTGLTAAGVALGVTSAPLIVTAAPVIAGVAGVSLTVSKNQQITVTQL